jgi:hypothetical protein
LRKALLLPRVNLLIADECRARQDDRGRSDFARVAGAPPHRFCRRGIAAVDAGTTALCAICRWGAIIIVSRWLKTAVGK